MTTVGPESFLATCKRREWIIGPGGRYNPRVAHTCDETFVGIDGAARLKAHMRDVHGKGTADKQWPFEVEPKLSRPVAHKAPRVGGQLDAVVAKWAASGELEVLDLDDEPTPEGGAA